MTARPRKQRSIVGLLLFAFTVTACGPTTSLEIGVQERQIRVALPTPEPIPPPVVAPQPRLRATAPGFVVAPRPLPEVQPPPVEGPPVVVETPQPVVCPTAHPEAAPDEPAPVVVDGPPAEGDYTFRQEGVLTFLDIDYPFNGNIVRSVENVEVTKTVDPSAIPGNPPVERTVIRYQVIEEAPVLKTTTTYRIEMNAAGGEDLPGGIFIEQIVNEGPLNATVAGVAQEEYGTESFTPSPSIQIADLPFEVLPPDAPHRVSAGVDPLTGLSMRVLYRTLGHQRIDACGDVVDSWSVEIAEGSEFVNPAVRRFGITGVNHFATSLGGLIVGSVMQLDGQFGEGPNALPFQQRTSIFINQLQPDPLVEEAANS